MWRCLSVNVLPVSISMATDIDQDGLISRPDMYTMLDLITDEPLKESDKKKVVDEVRVLGFIVKVE